MHTRTPLNQLGRKLFQLFSLVPIVTLAEPRSSVELPPPPPPRNFEGIKTAFKRHKIIPDLLSIAPKYTLEVTFSKEYHVDFGNYIEPAAWKQRPKKVHFAEAKKDRMYVLVMTGLDFPTRERPEGREWWYWVLGDLLGGPGAKGKDVMVYVGPDEMNIHSGLHRIVFLLMEQLDGRVLYEGKHLASTACESRRSCHNTTEFMVKYNLTAPVAGNFFTSGFIKSTKEPQTS
ncbi:protein D3 isoform X1 [Bemisia tabaci]|uniref:protein D3 isoform X1 n=1 Tax=Bemisia tabaci TaxID=7038 RepID=UPI003B28D246